MKSDIVKAVMIAAAGGVISALIIRFIDQRRAQP